MNKMTSNLFLIAEPRDVFSLLDCFSLEFFRSGVLDSLSLFFEMDFQRNVLPTSSEKLITPVELLLWEKAREKISILITSKSTYLHIIFRVFHQFFIAGRSMSFTWIHIDCHLLLQLILSCLSIQRTN